MRTVVLLGTTFLAASVASAQGVGDVETQLAHADELGKLGKELKDQLGPRHEVLSSGAHRLIDFGERWDEIKPAIRQALESKVTLLGPGSDPNASDDFISRVAGNTQSETSVGWCGDNAVDGFNDSGSFVATLTGVGGSPSLSFSFNGYSSSSDAGATFTDRGILLPDPLPPGVFFRDLFGDPVVRCSDSTTFYYSSIAQDTTPMGPFSGVTVSKSTDGGVTYGGAVSAVRKPLFGPDRRFLDKDWMDVDGNNIYVTYTDFALNTGTGGCPAGTLRTAIELVRSNDGGATWSAPVVIEQVCATPPFFQAFLQGSQVAVGPPAAVGLPGVVYVAWESYPNGFGPGRNIRIRASTNGGVSFGPTNMVTPVTRVGDGFRLQGGFRSFLDLGGLAVDNSMGPRRGNVYVTWQDGRNLAQSDPFSSDGTYRFGDILFTRSTSFGFGWSAPIRVNLDPITNPVDQFQPHLSVDNAGTVGVVFYDRREDGRNFLIDAELGVSINGGLTWSNLRLTPASFAAVHANDLVVNPVYMGDYIASASDRSGISSGFVLSWGDNSLGDANVEVEKFP